MPRRLSGVWPVCISTQRLDRPLACRVTAREWCFRRGTLGTPPLLSESYTRCLHMYVSGVSGEEPLVPRLQPLVPRLVPRVFQARNPWRLPPEGLPLSTLKGP